jgi:hypothetical protein
MEAAFQRNQRDPRPGIEFRAIFATDFCTE